MKDAAAKYIRGEIDDIISATAGSATQPNSFPGETLDPSSKLGSAPPSAWSPPSPPISPPQPLTAEYFAAAIKAEYQKAGLSSFTIAKLCAEAQCLGRKDKRRLTNELSLLFASAKFSRMAAIGACSAFYEPDIMPHLPAAWTIVEKLVGSTADELRQAIVEGILSPKITKKDAAAWANQHCAERIRRNHERQMRARQAEIRPVSQDDRDFKKMVTAYESGSPDAQTRFLESYLCRKPEAASGKLRWGWSFG